MPMTNTSPRDLIQQLAGLARRKHYTCEDPWYSCPQSECGSVNDNAGAECDCGADEHNAKVDAICAALSLPEPEDKVLARVEFAKRDFNGPSDVILAKYCDDWFYGDPERTEVDPVDLCRGAIELFAQTPAPIPLSEGLPNPEDCNVKGYCWVHDLHGNWCLIHYRAVKPSGFSHWLPYWALPEPQNGGDND